jgi:nicotinamide-nucleotide amidase
MDDLEMTIGQLLRQKGLTLGVVESATGGLISHRITNVPGSSDYYKGSITAYSNEIKMRLVGVPRTTLETHGAVSAATAEAMAAGGLQALQVDVCLADTGIAGPDGATADKPVGLFYLGLAHNGGVKSHRLVFSTDREENKRAAADAALTWLAGYLTELQ